MDRKKMNKTELFKECDRRGVGYMSNWTKPMLISRLKEEDKKQDSALDSMGLKPKIVH